MTEGYRGLRESAAWMDLSGRGVAVATGRDRVRFLHNLTSNHIKQLVAGAGCYAFLLNPQGRIQCDLNILCFEDRLLLDTEPETRERMLQHLGRYVIADQVTFEDASDTLRPVAVEGPGAAEALAAMGAPVPEADFSHLSWEDATVARISVTGAPGFRIFSGGEEMRRRLSRLPAASAADARTVRLEHGKPRYGEDIFETSLPQETGQMHGVHFQKGCYLGQEIVERIRARGHVNKLLTRVEIDGTEPPPPGTKLGEGVAEITSAAYSPALGKVAALAYVRTTHVQPGTVLGPGAVVA